jgi:hypothetical protein
MQNVMTPVRARILTLLARARSEGMTRKQLSKATGKNTGWSKDLGAATKEGFGDQGGGLQKHGLVHQEYRPGDRELTVTITDAGREALARYNAGHRW